MKIETKKLNAKYLIFTLLMAFFLLTLNCSNAKHDNATNEIVDVDFLTKIDGLRNQMIQEGSEFKNVRIQFISKTNRYVVADENIKVNSLIVQLLFSFLIFSFLKITIFCKFNLKY